MAIISLDDICNTITGYNNTLTTHGFKQAGGGTKAWSIRHTKDNLHVDVRSSEWTLYNGDEEIAVGRTPSQLADYLRDYNEYTSFSFA